MERTDELVQVREELEARQAAIRQRAQRLQQELQALQTGLRAQVETLLRQYTWVAVGGMALAGLLAGAWVRQRRRRRLQAGVGPQVDRYIATLTEEIAEALERGASVQEAVGKVLRKHPPLVIYLAPPAARPSILREVVLGVTLSLAQQMTPLLLERLSRR